MPSDKHCCVPGCTENQGRKQVLHQFPNPIKERECFNKWVYVSMPTLYMPGPLTLPNYTFSERKPMNLIQSYDDNILKPSTSTDCQKLTPSCMKMSMLEDTLRKENIDPSVEANISHPNISTIGNVLSPCAIEKK
ncbi:unnamed protein product [Parnassius apollo]|uniref:(apollo) hypothetical protein n=1 Tax=Parnassius apollo TaxID=110799 RepID=A0A8S3WWG7_PARAO|nr:unnamed protein product [Parnassius apollo]